MGGLAGHMSHVHEDLNLTFNQIIEIMTQLSTGEITPVEKVDGQNIYFRHDIEDGITKFARNKSHFNLGGLTRQQMVEDFERKKKPGDEKYQTVIDTYDKGMSVIEAGINACTPEILEACFGNQYNYVNAELMTPGKENVVIYDGSYIVLHMIDIMDPYFTKLSQEDPEQFEIEISEVDTAARAAFSQLVSVVENIENEYAMQDWSIKGPAIIDLINLAEGDTLNKHIEKIEDYVNSCGLTLEDKLGDAVKFAIENIIIPEALPGINSKAKQMIVSTIMNLPDKPRSVTNIIKLAPRYDASLIKSLADSKGKKLSLGIAINPFVKIMHNFAVDLLLDSESRFMESPKKSLERIKMMTRIALEELPARFDQRKGEAEASGDTKAMNRVLSDIKRFEKQVKKLEDVERISAAYEGIVFEYPPNSRRKYKFTGNFAPVNQILGLGGFDFKSDLISRAKKEIMQENNRNISMKKAELKKLISSLIISL